MSRSKRAHEGELMIDHRFTPGMPDKLMMPNGFPAGAGHGLFEAPTYTCNHCPQIVLVNPLRNRQRAWCRHCDRYLCDRCGGILAATRACKPYTRVLDELQEQAFLDEQKTGVIFHG